MSDELLAACAEVDDLTPSVPPLLNNGQRCLYEARREADALIGMCRGRAMTSSERNRMEELVFVQYHAAMFNDGGL